MPLHYIEERTIDAPAETVFDVIADFPNYAEWNPWIERVEGKPEPGTDLVVDSVMGNRRPKFRHRMLTADRPYVFHWCDLGWFTLFAKGERKRTIEPVTDTQCVYRVELNVTGSGSGLASLFFGKFMKNGLNGEASGLKTRAEQLHKQA
ncbi:Uncharacterised protein [BD1-7 clade bacterium]|uniref:Coenzyme Q-binding protein COQ10 START domain-containing protein n=1 Tax=BD1-7 clade bacterium TaxID=2029982 RepID=A0A5S9MZD9_9GAMM|nr:Uncharacterised protein [BD1-7 clade bacterium]